MAEDSVLYLSRKDVVSTGLSMGEIIEALDAMFLEKGNGKVEMPPKPGIHTQPDAFIHAMPAYIPSLGSAGMKWVSGYPANQEKGLPYISGLLILNNPENGIPICVMDCAWVTAMRTARTIDKKVLGLRVLRIAWPPGLTATSMTREVAGRAGCHG